MSTQLHAAAGTAPEMTVRPADDAFDCTIVTASWNSHITHPLRDGAVQCLTQAGVPAQRIRLFDVPGTVELVKAARLAQKAGAATVIMIGCVIRGDTPHFDYVCQIAAQGCAQLNTADGAPVLFGVLTVDNEQQAIDRSGGKLGNKGYEAAQAAVAMYNLAREMK